MAVRAAKQAKTTITRWCTAAAFYFSKSRYGLTGLTPCGTPEMLVKWRIFTQTGKIGSGKNTKSLFFLLGLKYTLRTCFESKIFCQIWQAEKWRTWYLSSGQEFDENFLDSKHVFKVYFKPSRKNKDFVFLPDPILPGWLKILHLNCYSHFQVKSSTYLFLHISFV